MSATKYGQYIMKPAGKTALKSGMSSVMPVLLEGLKDWGGIQHRMKWSFITAPALVMDEPHTHDFDEFLCFLNYRPENEEDFQAEIELSLGEEGEKQTIISPTIVCVPEGLVHGPVNFKTVDLPVIFVRIYLAPEYVRKPVSL